MSIARWQDDATIILRGHLAQCGAHPDSHPARRGGYEFSSEVDTDLVRSPVPWHGAGWLRQFAKARHAAADGRADSRRGRPCAHYRAHRSPHGHPRPALSDAHAPSADRNAHADSDFRAAD